MTISQRQKNIVNPYPEDYSDINDFSHPSSVPSGGANGQDYNYDSERNKWIIEGIHDCFLNYGYFPRIGKILKQLGPISSENNVLTLSDVMAYAALYPQNGVVVGNPLFAVPDNALEDSDAARRNAELGAAPLGLMSRTSNAGLKKLQDIVVGLIEKGTLDKFYSITAPELQRSSNEVLFKILAQKSFSALTTENQGLYRPMLQSALVTVAPLKDDIRLAEIRKTFGNDPEAPLLLPRSELQTQAEIYLNKQPTGIDFTEWSTNITPDSEKKIVYYNPTSREVYYCVRTNSRDPESFDAAKRQRDQVQKDNVENFKREALKAMVVFSERFFENEQQIEDNIEFLNFEARYGDSFRAPLPAGYGVWLIAASVPLSVITQFPENLTENDTESLPLKTNPSPLQLSRNLIKNLAPRHRFAHKIKDMEQYVSEMVKVLNFYNDKLYEEGVEHNVLNKLNLEREILRLEQFMPLLYQLGTAVGVSLTPQDYVEIHLSDTYEILYFNINGASYFQHLGRDIKTLLPPKADIVIDVVLREDGTPEIETKNRSEWESYENIFSNLTPTTLAYLLNSKKISRLSQKLESGNIPPWSDFFITYTYPNPNKNSFELVKDQQRARQKETVTTGASVKTPKQLEGVLAGTHGPDVKGFKSTKDVQRILKKRSKTQQQMYMLVRNSTRKCNTGFGRATQTLMDGYLTFSKGRPADMVAFVVHTIRNDIIDLLVATNRASPEQAGNLRRDIDTANSYARDPDQVRRQIEKYVNDQISGCLDLIGDIVIDTVIDPAVKPSSKGMAGPIKKYWKDAIKPPGSLRIPKTPTSNFFGAWGKKLKELTLKMIEQLILSILGDVISSLLGCGPSLPNTTPTKMKGGTNAAFGAIRINDVAEDNSIDLLEVAESLSMVNIAVSLDGEGNKQTSSSPATLEQLKQLNNDVSDFLTKTEALALLDGNLSPLTMAAIEEMINQGPYSVPSTTIIVESLQTDKQYMAQFQESLKRDDTKYATLGLNIELIRMYFSAIGDQSLNTADLLDNLDPREAFCAKYNISDDSPLLDLGISQAQLNAQIDNEVSQKVDKIKNLCDMFAYDGFAWQQDVINFFEQFPVASSYNSLLSAISKASQEAQKALLEAMKAQQDSTQNEPPTVLEYTQTEFYEFCEGIFGRAYMQPAPLVQRPGIFQWSLGDLESGQISFMLTDKSVIWFYQDEEDYKMWFANPLSPSNNPTPSGENEEPTYSLRGLAQSSGRQALGEPESYPATSEIATAMKDISFGIESDIRPNPENKQRSHGQSSFISIMDNGSTLTELLGVFWVSPIGIRRLQPLRETLGKPAFIPGGPRCKNNQSKAIAEAAYFGIEIRVINFLLNVGPLMRAFPGWMTPDVLNVLSSYLTQKIFKEWADKNILNVYVDALTDMDTNYSTGESNQSGYSLEIDSGAGQRRQVAYIISQILSTFFTRLGKGRAYAYPGTNFFDSESMWTTEGIYVRSVLEDYKTLAHAYRTSQWKFPGGYGVEPFIENIPLEGGNSLSGLMPGVPSVDADPGTDGKWETRDALYYLPVPLITAMQILYFDHTVNINNKWPQFRFNTGRQVALADDALLSAVNEASVTIFSNPYNGYPVTIEGERYYSREEIIEKIIQLQAQRKRIFELESIFGPLTLYDEDYRNLAYKHSLEGSYLAKNIEQYRDFFNTLYGSTSSTYLRIYNTWESREILQRAALNQFYTPEYPANFSAGGAEDSIDWIRQRGWYERARLLGYAPDDDYEESLLYKWVQGEDSPRMTIEEKNDAGDIVTRQMKPSEWNALKAIRGATLEANSFNNDEGWHFNDGAFFAPFWSDDFPEVSRNHWSARATDASLEMMEDGQYIQGFVFATISIQLEALFNPSTQPFAWVNPINWVLWAGEWLSNWVDDWDKYFNPNDSDALRWMRNPPPTMLPDGTAAAYLDVNGDLIKSAQKISGHKGSATSLGTLDKIAIAKMYYELAWRSQLQKPNSDPHNPESEILLLLDYIGETDQQEFYGTAFPAYLDMKHRKLAFATMGAGNNPIKADHLSMRAYVSMTALEGELARLQLHPIMRRRNEYNEKRNAIETLYNEIVQLMNDFEADANGIADFSPSLTQMRKFLNTENNELALRQFIDLTVDANLDLFGDTRWDEHRDDVVENFRDEVDDEIWWADENGPGYDKLLDLRLAIFGTAYDQPPEGGPLGEIMVLISQLQAMYADLTNDRSASPRVSVGINYDEYGMDGEGHLDTTTIARTWSMYDWLQAFDADIKLLSAQITWRES